MESGNVPGDLSRRMRLRSGEAVTIDNDALYVSHSSTEKGRVVASLRPAARWLEAIEIPVALLSSAPDPGKSRDICRPK
jgi:hypothetical protein